MKEREGWGGGKEKKRKKTRLKPPQHVRHEELEKK